MKSLHALLVGLCLLSGSRDSISAESVSKRATDVELSNSISQVIDELIDAKLAGQGIEPASQTSDSNLIRRLTLDLAGRIPAVVEVKAFLDPDPVDNSAAPAGIRAAHPEGRQRLVERLMASDEFNQYMAARFDWFIAQGDGGIREYLTNAFRQRVGWDRIFQDILLADLSSREQAISYLKSRVKDSERLTNEVSITFLGVNISCAKCHDHPLVSDWTQDHFYGMKSFFDRTFENGGFVAEREYGMVSYTTTAGDERQARLMFLTGTDVTPEQGLEPGEEERERLKKLYGELKKKKEPTPPPKLSLRQQLVDVALAEGQNYFFARSIVNRVWHHFFGYGLVMPLDQMHAENAPSHPELLEWLADDLISHKYDLRRLIRGIVLSRAYSRSSLWNLAERPSPSLFAVAGIRPLTPTQIARSLSLATADQSTFRSSYCDELQCEVIRAAEPRNIDSFGQPADDFRVPAVEALLFSNAERFEVDYLKAGLVEELTGCTGTGRRADRQQVIETAIWSILSRAPDAEEIELFSEYLDAREDRWTQAVQQLVWGLLASSEFRFNH